MGEKLNNIKVNISLDKCFEIAQSLSYTLFNKMSLKDTVIACVDFAVLRVYA